MVQTPKKWFLNLKIGGWKLENCHYGVKHYSCIGTHLNLYEKSSRQMTRFLYFKNAVRDHWNFSLESHQWWLIIIIVMCIKNTYTTNTGIHHHHQGWPDSTFRYEIIEIWVHFTNGAAWGASSSSWIGAHLSLEIKIANNIIIITITIRGCS